MIQEKVSFYGRNAEAQLLVKFKLVTKGAGTYLQFLKTIVPQTPDQQGKHTAGDRE